MQATRGSCENVQAGGGINTARQPQWGSCGGGREVAWVTNRRLSTGRVASRCRLSATETGRRYRFLYAIVLPDEPSSETVYFNQRHSRDSAVDSRVGFWGLKKQVRLRRCR